MPEVVELRGGEKPRHHEHYALVYVSSQPPHEGVAIAAHEFGQTFFATDNEHDVSVIVGRAKIWAGRNNVARVYVKRDITKRPAH
jgi:hypothetical protein